MKDKIKNSQIGLGDVRNLQEFSDAEKAVARITEIYERNTKLIRDTFLEIAASKNPPKNLSKLKDATYPYVGITVDSHNLNVNDRSSFGAVLEPGTYGATLTRPDIFSDYYKNQIDLLLRHHHASIFVGESNIPIPLSFVDEWDSINFSHEKSWQMPIAFVLPNLSDMNDHIVNGTYEVKPGQPLPLALFRAERVDLSLGRLHHYCGTSAKHFQDFILLTNYQRYIDENLLQKF
jgi:AMP nucleosidase